MAAVLETDFAVDPHVIPQYGALLALAALMGMTAATTAPRTASRMSLRFTTTSLVGRLP